MMRDLSSCRLIIGQCWEDAGRGRPTRDLLQICYESVCTIGIKLIIPFIMKTTLFHIYGLLSPLACRCKSRQVCTGFAADTS